jgi:hypothetical protein
MNRLPVNTIIAFAFLTLGTFAFSAAVIADSIAKSDSFLCLLLLFLAVIYLFFGFAFIAFQYSDNKKIEKRTKEKNEKDPS